MLTWSLGSTGVFDPNWPPRISMARLAMSSLAFMLVWVPELVCQFAADHLVGGFDDGLAKLLAQHAQGHIDQGRSLFLDAQRPHQRPWHDFFADVEIHQAALGLRAPVLIGGDLDRPRGIGL